MRRSWLRAAAWVGFIGITAFVALRTYASCNVVGRPDLPFYGMQDFRDAIYYPALAFLSGINPYSPRPFLQLYPAGQQLGPYAPAVLLVYAPLTALGIRHAEVVFFLFNVGCILALAATILALCNIERTAAGVLGLATLLLLSRPGHSTLFLGQCTFYVLTGSFLALRWGRARPSAAGVAFGLTMLKPTFGVPLGVLMLCLGEWEPVLIGAVLCGVVSLLALLRLVVAANLPTVVRGVLASLDMLGIALNEPRTSLRIDVPGLVERFTGLEASGVGGTLITGLVIVFGAVAIRWATRAGRQRDRHLVWALVCLTVVACTYHQPYDALILALPATALVLGGWRPRLGTLGPATWLLLLACFVLPGINYVSTYHFVARFEVTGAWWLALASVNGAVIALALLLCAAEAYGSAEAPRPAAVSDSATGSRVSAMNATQQSAQP